MATLPPSDIRYVLTHDFRLALLVAMLLAVGSGVSLEDDFNLSVAAQGDESVLPSPYVGRRGTTVVRRRSRWRPHSGAGPRRRLRRRRC